MSFIEPAFGTISDCFEIVVLSIFQDIQFKRYSLTDYRNDNMYTSLYFYMLFLFYNTFALQFFLAIVVFPFSNLRRKYQLSIEAAVAYENESQVPLGKTLNYLLMFRII